MSGRQVGGRYILEKKIAGGGMGAIWLAHDPQLDRKVALKLTTSLRISSDSARRQFEQEARQILDALLFVPGALAFLLVLLPHAQEQQARRHQDENRQHTREGGT